MEESLNSMHERSDSDAKKILIALGAGFAFPSGVIVYAGLFLRSQPKRFPIALKSREVIAAST